MLAFDPGDLLHLGNLANITDDLCEVVPAIDLYRKV